MVNLLSHFAFAVAAFASSPVAPQADVSNPLAGTWVMDRFVDMPEGEEAIYPLGKRPVGLFIFTEDCRFSFNVMKRPDEPDRTSDAPWTPSWYISYFGTYRYDLAASSWTTHVEGGNIPSYIGTDQTRPFAISGDTLIISNSYVDEGRTIHIERTLRRATAAQSADSHIAPNSSRTMLPETSPEPASSTPNGSCAAD